MIHGLIAFLLASQPPAAMGIAARKHDYCVVKPEGQTPRCLDCSVRLGGEGGKLICSYKFGRGKVRYGRCDESRNRPPC
jgi:hypothetical protein